MTREISGRIAAAIFRHTLYLPSERFIPDQAAALTSSDVTMIARDPIENSDPRLRSVTLSSQGPTARVRHTVLMDPAPLQRMLREVQPDVLHAHFGVEGMYSQRASAKAGIPHVTTLHGFDVSLSRAALMSSRTPSWIYYGALRKRHLRSGSALICVSSHVQRLAIELGAKPENTFVIGTGVNTETIDFSAVPNKPVVVHVARLVEKKGTEFLIRAFPEVLRTVPEAQLRVIGTGPLMESLKALAHELGIEGSVVFRGAQPHAEVLKEIAAARLLCLPSVTAQSGDQEGLGQVILEAGAIGRPVVATRHGGIVDGVRDGETGILVPERAAGALADALTEVLKDDASAQRMGTAGRRFVVSDFDLYGQARKVEDLYRSL